MRRLTSPDDSYYVLQPAEPMRAPLDVPGVIAEVDDDESSGELSEGIDDPGEAPREEDAARDEDEPHRDVDGSS